MKILNLYKWATVGGVERVLLNRARAFKQHGIDVKQDVFFFHDSGGLRNFCKYIEYFQLEGYMTLVQDIDEKAYDLIFMFDTPEAFDYVSDTSRVVVECHSPYKESRIYLKTLPTNITRVVSPSVSFIESVVQNEVPDVFTERLFVLPNFYINSVHMDVPLTKIWGKTPICYVGRMDSLKNTKELLDIFTVIRKELGDDYFLLLAGDVRPHYMDLRETIKKLRIEGRAAYFRPIPFEKVDALLSVVKHHKGIFVSPSLGESFGLSALEAMANGIPVLLSDIECHKPLVDGDPAFLYGAGNIREAVKKVAHISGNYDNLATKAKQLAAKHNSDAFIEAWGKLCAFAL